MNFHCTKMFCVKLLVVLTFFNIFGNVTSNNPVDTTYYDLLQVSVTATQQEIRQAYKKLAIKLHPDKNPNQSVQEKFVKVTEAYETLKDPDKRLKYDRHGYQADSGQFNFKFKSKFHDGLYAGDLYVDNLSSKNYFAYLTEGYHFINFYSPFCPPCQKLSDIWKKLAETFKNLVKLAAVNCNSDNNFCFNTMRVSSYPTLIFYRNGKSEYLKVYRGEMSYESIEKYIMSYIIDDISLMQNRLVPYNSKPTVYILGESWLHEYTVARIALHWKGLAQVVKITDEALRSKLSGDEYDTVVLEFEAKRYHINVIEEQDILQQIADFLADLPVVTAETIWEIRNKLRSNTDEKPWVIYFKDKGNSDRLLAQKLKHQFTELNFGEMDCDDFPQLCASLQVQEVPAWSIMKDGGAYERFHGKNIFQSVFTFIKTSKDTPNVQSLSVSEFRRIISGDSSVWVVAVIPYKMSFENLVESFTEASHIFKSMQFGIMMCQKNSEKYCHEITMNNPAIIFQNKTQRFKYGEQSKSLIEFIENVMDNSGCQLTEDEFYERIEKMSNKIYSQAIAFFPELCNDRCQQIKYEWNIVSRKLVPVENLKVAFVDCSSERSICSQLKIKSPILRVYPASSSHNYVAQLNTLNEAAYILEWLLNTVDDSIKHLSAHDFTQNVLTTARDFTLSDESNIPWLVYFHSPRCRHCYEMYTDFYITGLSLKNKVKVGKVNCLQERRLCGDEQIRSYPSIKLYIKNEFKTKSYQFRPQHYTVLLHDLEKYISTDDYTNFRKVSIDPTHDFKHNEL